MGATFLRSSPPPTATPPAPPSQADVIDRSVRGTEHRTRALVVRAVPYAESDLIVGLFTESLGRVSALARGARASGRRKLQLEPMHTLDVTLRERAGASLLSLPSASIAIPRVRLLSAFDRLEAAGLALRWVRQATPARTPEPEVWDILARFLDALDQPTTPAAPAQLLVVTGLLLLQALGYALELDRCVSCGRPCAEDRSAHVDAVRGGLVCRRCGGAGVTLTGPSRARLKLAAQGALALEPEDQQTAIELVESALLAHANVR